MMPQLLGTGDSLSTLAMMLSDLAEDINVSRNSTGSISSKDGFMVLLKSR